MGGRFWIQIRAAPLRPGRSATRSAGSRTISNRSVQLLIPPRQSKIQTPTRAQRSAPRSARRAASERCRGRRAGSVGGERLHTTYYVSRPAAAAARASSSGGGSNLSKERRLLAEPVGSEEVARQETLGVLEVEAAEAAGRAPQRDLPQLCARAAGRGAASAAAMGRDESGRGSPACQARRPVRAITSTKGFRDSTMGTALRASAAVARKGSSERRNGGGGRHAHRRCGVPRRVPDHRLAS